jgi:hypothetical protein
MENIVANPFYVGSQITCIETKPLPGNRIAPSLKDGQYYQVEQVFTCVCGQEHLHVGLQSVANYINCYRCGKEIPEGDTKHWCHPSRFINRPVGTGA